jgi:hypothetical protein
MPGQLSFRATAIVVGAFAVAIAYLEAAVVVYLTGALGGEVGVLFPLLPADEVGNLIAIEVGREAATIVIIATVGILVGLTWLERLAWCAVVFGVWDIGYYAWLDVFTGWPLPRHVDLLFIPVVVGDLAADRISTRLSAGRGARQLRSGRAWRSGWHCLAGLGGGSRRPLVRSTPHGSSRWPAFTSGRFWRGCWWRQ